MSTARRIQRGERLVQNPEACLARDQSRQQHAPLLPGGQEAHRQVLAALQAEAVQRSDGFVAIQRGAVELGRKLQIFQRGEFFLHSAVVPEKQQRLAISLCVLARRLSAPADLAGRRRGQAGQQAQQAGLAAAVGSAHVQPLAGTDLEVESAEQGSFAAHAAELVGAQH